MTANGASISASVYSNQRPKRLPALVRARSHEAPDPLVLRRRPERLLVLGLSGSSVTSRPRKLPGQGHYGLPSPASGLGRRGRSGASAEVMACAARVTGSDRF